MSGSQEWHPLKPSRFSESLEMNKAVDKEEPSAIPTAKSSIMSTPEFLHELNTPDFLQDTYQIPPLPDLPQLGQNP